ncbi:amino acid adenylation domain-containing protein, partial [Bacillus toyonensis]|uniref:non-ribosomal peptide synthetase n=1 Tax=Bacillus toyonensis TaxID=155322 RepID=UPI001F10131F
MSTQQIMQKIYPLTPMQEGMLYHSLLEENKNTFLVQLSFGVKGDLQLNLLEKSFQSLIQRHDVFRTIFNYDKAKQPIQIVLEQRKNEVQFKDITELKKDDKLEALKQFKQKDKEIGFDLTKDSLIRLSVFKTADRDFQFVFSFHHIIVDGWCLSTIVKELFEMYHAFFENRNIHLEETEPYNKYIQWLNNQDNEESHLYWKNYLDEFTEPTQLPWRRQNKVKGYAQEKVDFTIDKNETNRLMTLARDNNVTLSTLFQAIWGIVLKRYNNSNDIVFGSVVSGRHANINGIEKMVGLFINTNPVRIQFAPEIQFNKLVNNLQSRMLDSEEHSHFPLAKIQSDSDVKQGLIDHIVAFENVPLEVDFLGGHQFGGLEIYDFDLFEQTNFDFNLIVIPTDELSVSLKYNSFVYNHEDIERIAGHIKQTVTQVLENPSIKISEIDIMTVNERHEIINTFNDTKVNYNKEKLLHEFFEEKAEASPEKIALIFGEKAMTYQEVNERANQLARMLRQSGVQRNSIVGMLVDRSFEMMIGILAVHKAGAAYLPIDPAFPEERVQFILEDSRTNVLLTQSHFKNHLDLEQVVITIDDEMCYKGNSSNLDKINSAEDLAYVIYTSGSTGNPKGVMIKHCSVVNNMNWMQRKYPITGNDVIMQKTPYTFDVSVFELCWWYFQGATLNFLQPGGEKDPEIIIDEIERNNVTVIHFVPSMLQAFLDYLQFGDNHVKRLKSIQKVFSSGEALTTQHVNRFNEIWRGNKQITLSNLYGPTEATIHVSYYDCPKSCEVKSIPIGRPVDNIQLYIIDQDQQLQPVSVPGELCIAGEGLANGYLKQLELTEEKFVSNPFDPDKKMYKTGDLARILPDGNIEYMGRMDYQLKIKGYRVEIGEIESYLHQYEGIKQALVTMNEDSKGNKYLCAYLVMTGYLNEKDLKEYLTLKLPEYMVPSYFMTLDNFPLNSSGKVDRKSLPLPVIKEEVIDTYEGPRNEIEKNLVQVWQDVLGIEQVSIHDNFFALGGDSIKAIQVTSRLQKYHLKVAIKDIFKYSTIAQLSQQAKTFHKIFDQSLVEGEIALTPIQNWFFEQRLANMNHWNQAFMLYRKDGFNIEAVEQTFKHIITHHDALRMVYSFSDDSIIQKNLGVSNKLFDLSVIDLRNEVNIEEKIERIVNDIHGSISLTNGPLVKLGLFKTSDGDHLHIVIHHLVIDGVSWRILLEDFAKGYEQAISNQDIRLQEKTSSYKDWASTLVKYANSEGLLKEIPYWNSLNQIETGILPKDNIININKIKDANNVQLTLSLTETEKLLRKTNLAYNTEINDIFMTALGMTLEKWTGRQKILVSLEGHGREEINSQIDVTRTIGWFTSMFPVILDMSMTSTISSQINMVKKTLQNIPNKGIGYGILKYLTDEKNKQNLKCELQPDICFNYLGQLDQEKDMNVFSISTLSSGQALNPNSERAYSIDITGAVIKGQLVFDFIYNKFEYEEETMNKLVSNFERNLLGIIEHCINQKPTQLSLNKETDSSFASIYPEASLDSENVNRPFPLTDIQMAYFLGRNEEFEMGGVATHVYTEVETVFDMERFNKSLNKVIRRHPMLRAIILPGGEQSILKDVPEYKIEIVDIRHLNEDEKQQCIKQERNLMSHHVFETDQWPLFKFKAYRISDDKHLLCMGRDLLIADAASMDIIGSDLMSYYHNLDSNLPEVEFTFRDYLLAYKELKKSDVYETDKKYWLQKLEDFPTSPVLPLKCDPADIKMPKFNRKERIYSKEDWNKLKNISLQHGVTPSALLATIYAKVLALWSNQSDLTINLTVFNRYPFNKDVDNIVGDFTSSLLLGIHLEPQSSLWNNAKNVQDILIESLEHRHYEGVEFIRDIIKFHNFEHGKAVMPFVFTSVLTEENQNARPGLEQLGDLKTGITQTSQVYIDFQATLLENELWLFWDYVEDLFEVEMIDSLFNQFAAVIDGLIESANVVDIKITENDKKIIETYNDTEESIPFTTLHALFEEQVKRVPEAVAVMFKEESMTYRELHERSNQIACYLNEQGIGRNDFVGVLASRQIETIVNVMGILKAGAAYVPVDPEYPEERRS